MKSNKKQKPKIYRVCHMDCDSDHACISYHDTTQKRNKSHLVSVLHTSD